MATPKHEDPLWSTDQAANYVCYSASRLHQWRAERNNPGPAFLQLGRRVRYRKSDLDAWLAAARVESSRVKK